MLMARKEKFDLKITGLDQFTTRANEIACIYYLQPFNGEAKADILSGKLERPVHGAMHVSRVVSYVGLLHNLQFKHRHKAVQKYLENLSAVFNTDNESILLLTKYAAMLHDAGRKAEGPDKWDADSADITSNYLIKKKVPAEIAAYFKALIEYKDDLRGFKKQIDGLNNHYQLSVDVSAIEYVHGLLHDSDCLDVIRTRSSFDMDYLSCSKSFKDIGAYRELKKLVKFVATLISTQKDAGCRTILVSEETQQGARAREVLIESATFREAGKKRYEHSEYPFSTITKDINDKYGKSKQQHSANPRIEKWVADNVHGEYPLSAVNTNVDHEDSKTMRPESAPLRTEKIKINNTRISKFIAIYGKFLVEFLSKVSQFARGVEVLG